MSSSPTHDRSTRHADQPGSAAGVGTVLRDYGWNERLIALLDPADMGELRLARVIADDRTTITVITEDGAERVDRRLDVTTGDWVLLSPSTPAVLVRLVPRWTEVCRHDAGRTSVRQTLAANVDVCLIALGLDRELNPRRLERLLAVAWDSGADPVVVLTKADVAHDVDSVVTDAQRFSPGVEVLVTSATTGIGLEALRARVTAGRTAVLLGESGAGKSSLANALVGDELLETREVRARDAKGRHTTTRRQLLPIPGAGVLLDTPGLRGIGLAGDAAGGLARTFADVEAHADGCRFSDCQHATEPGCAVLQAVDDGHLDPDRLTAYVALHAEQAAAALRADARQSRAVQRQRGREYKQIRDRRDAERGERW